MSAYYSIISAMIRPEIQEKISIGLLLVSGSDVFLSTSKTKISIAKDLFPEHLYNGLRNEVKGVRDIYLKLKEEESRNILFDSAYKSIIEENYITYLSNYKNSILVFSSPQKLSMNVNENIFGKLYEKYVDIDPFLDKIEEEIKPIERFRKDYIPSLSKYYNTNITVGRELLPDAILPLKFDLVGRNNIDVFAKSIDLERRRYNVEHDVNAFYPLKDLSPKSKKFLITKEPEKKYSAQHTIWKNLKNSSWLEYIDLSETGRLEEYAKKHHVEPIMKEDNETVNN